MAFDFSKFVKKKGAAEAEEIFLPVSGDAADEGFHDKRRHSKLDAMLALEPRILLDAALADTVVKVADAAASHAVAEHGSFKPQADLNDAMAAMAPVLRDHVRREVIFVDAGAANIEALLGAATPERQVVVLQADADGVQQMTEALEKMGRVDAIHIFSHGGAGRIQLGNGELSAENIQSYREQLAAWAAHMTNAADIMIYGCDVAEGQRGADFVRILAELTQADVAASTDLTGDAAQGGDWVLEKVVGRIESDIALSVHGREGFKETLAYTNATFGNRLYFDGAANLGRVTISNGTNAIMDPTQNIAIEAWIKPDSGSGTGVKNIVTAMNTAADSTPGALVLANGKLRFYTQTSTPPTPTFNYVETSSTIGTFDGSTWYHVAATWDATTKAVKFYVNGSQVATGTYINQGVGGTSLNAGTTSTQITIGNRGDSNTSQKFAGEIDDVRIFMGTLPTINATHINSELAGNETGLTGYWKFNTGTGTTASDSQTNITAHNGSFSSLTWIDPPTIGGTAVPTGINDNQTSSPFSAVTFSQTDTTNVTVTITQSGTGKGNGSFSTLGDGTNNFTDNGNGSYTLSGVSVSAAQASIRAMVFTPTANQVAVASTVDTTFTLSVTDSTTTASTDSTTVLTVTSVNDAPGGIGNVTLAAVAEDTASGSISGQAISAMTNYNATDADVSGSVTGIAVVGNTANATTEGAWQYSTNAGSNWFDIGTVADDNTALALSISTLIRFVPVANFNGAPTGLTVRALDNTYGGSFSTTAGTETRNLASVATTGTGGTTAIAGSTNTIGTTITAVNDAPTGMGNTTVPAVNEDTASPAGVAISALTSLNFQDVDSGSSLSGIAVVGNTANATTEGVWQYSSDGTHWTAISSSVNDGASAQALSASTKVRFVPVANFNGTPTSLTVRALDNSYAGSFSTWDGTTESAATVDTSSPGGTTAIASATNTIGTSITAVNDAPTGMGDTTVAAVNEDTAAPSGVAISSLTGLNFQDVDSGSSLSGIAVVGNTANATTEGAWQYSTNAGTNWFDIGTVADNSTALALSSSALVRFVPVANFNGTAPSLTVRALDNTYAGSFSTTAGTETRANVDTTSPGGTTAIASATNTIGTSITAVNDAPTGMGNTTVPAVDEGATSPSGVAISSLTGLNFQDVDATSSLSGIAVVGNTANATTEGAWQYSTNAGTNWFDIGTVADNTTALALSSSTLVRFVPAGNFNGTPTTLTVRALDNTYAGSFSTTAGTETRANVDTTSPGGTTAIASATNTVGTTVNAVNDAPTATATTNPYSATEQTNLNLHGTGLSIADVDAPTGNVQVTLSVTEGIITVALGNSGVTLTNNGGGSANGTASVELTGTITQINALLGGTSTGTIIYNDNTNSPSASATLTIAVDDLNAGAQGSGGNLTGSTTSTINITAVNDAPTLTAPTPLTPTYTEHDVAGVAITDNTFAINTIESGQTVASLVIEVTNVQDPTNETILIDGQEIALNATAGDTTTSGIHYVTANPSGSTYTITLTKTASTISVTDAESLIKNATYQYNGHALVAGTARGVSVTVQDSGGTANSGADTSIKTSLATITVVPTNDAPVISASPPNFEIQAFNEDPTTNTGVTVAALIASSAISDPDGTGVVKGIAVEAVDTTEGVWEYSLDSGTTWIDMNKASDNTTASAIAEGNALLLSDTSTTRIRFVPNANYFTQTAGPTISFYAWDQTTGTEQGRVDLTNIANRGGSTAYSLVAQTAHVTVNAVQDAPVLTAATPSLTGGATASPTTGVTVATIVGGNISDADLTTAVKAIAVTGTTLIGGTDDFEYSTDGGTTWTAFGTVSAASSLLLDSTNLVRYNSANGGAGTGSFTFRAWDQTTNAAGAAGTKVSTATTGGTSEFSAVQDTASVTIVAGATPSFTSISNDSGTGGDYITNDANLVVNGSLSQALGVGEKVQVSFDNGTTWVDASAQPGVGTTWSHDNTATTLSGTFTMFSRVVDSGNNQLTISGGQSVTIDTVANPPALPNMTAGTDTGPEPADNITKNTQPTFEGIDGSVEGNATVELFVDGISFGTVTASAAGGWTFSAANYPGTTSGALAAKMDGTGFLDGTYLITAKQTDVAGNISNASSALSITVDTVAANPGLTAPASGYVTTTSPTMSGSAEPGATVKVYDTDGTTVLGTFTASLADGSWSGTPTTPLTQGAHTLKVEQTDLAGNISGLATVAITVDSIPPSQPATPVLNADTGLNGADGIINNNKPTFQGAGGSVENNASVEVFVDGVSIGTTTANGSGAWSLSAVNAIADGSHNVTIKATDAAGNTSVASSALAITVDTAAPSAPAVPDLAAASDLGTSSTDNITSDTTPTFQGANGSVEANAQVEVFVDGVSNGTTTANGSGAWSYTASALTNGTHSITAKQTDVAGNVSTASTALSVTVDAAAPSQPSAPDLAAASDSGSSSTDNLTNVTTPVLQGANGSVEANAIVEVFNGGVSMGTTTADANGAWSFTVPGGSALSTGANNITVKATDAAGNTSVASSALAVTVDVAAPNAPSSAPTVSANSGGGINASEASGGTPATVTLAVTGAAAGDIVSVQWGGQTVNYTLTGTDITNNSATITIPATTISAQGDGTFNVTATITDQAGNQSSLSSATSVTVDTGVPSAPAAPTVSENAGGGINATEAADGTPVVVSLAGTGAAAGDTLTVNWGGQQVTYTLQASDITNGNATVTVSSGTITTQGTGTFNVTSFITDQVGNVGATSAATSVTVDTVAPNAPSAPTVSENGGGGINAAEASNGTPVVVSLSGTTAAAGDVVTVNWGGQTLNYTLTASDISGGSATVTVPAATISTQGDGTFNVTALITDSVGNASSTSAATSVTVDTVAPTTTVGSVSLSSDTGSSATDRITSTAAQTISGTLSSTLAGGEVLYGSIDGGATWTDITSKVSGTAIAWNGVTLNAGTSSISFRVSDAVGNDGPVSSAAYSLDTASVTPTVNAPAAGYLNSATPTVSGTAEAGATVRVYDTDGTTLLGTTTASNTGAWSLTSASLSQGAHTLNIKATDVAGNLSSTVTRAITVDSIAPAAPGKPTVSENAGGGINATEAANGTPVAVSLTGTGAVAGDTLRVNWGAQAVNYTLTAADISNGSVTVTVSAATIAAQGNGTFNVTSQVVDQAGNASVNSTATTVTVDTVAAAPTVTSFVAGGTIATKTPTFSGRAEPGASVSITVDGTPLATVLADASGAWTYTSADLATGGHTLGVSQVDLAGNTSGVNLLAFTIGGGNTFNLLSTSTVTTTAGTTTTGTTPTTGTATATQSATGTAGTSGGQPGTAQGATPILNLAQQTQAAVTGTGNSEQLSSLASTPTLPTTPTTAQTQAEAILNQALNTPTAAGGDKAAGGQGNAGAQGGNQAAGQTGGTTGQVTGGQPAASGADGGKAQGQAQDTGAKPDAGTGGQANAADGTAGGGQGAVDAGALKVEAGIPDQSIVMSQQTMEFSIPDNSFSRPTDGVQLNYRVTLADDTPLPEYVSFDAKTGKFVIDRDKLPAGKTEVSVKVQATDSKGGVAETVFRITVQKGGDTSRLAPESMPFSGGMNLSDQILSAVQEHDAPMRDLLASLEELSKG